MPKIKQSISRKLGNNVDLNRKALSLRKSWNEVASLLQTDKGNKKK